MKTQVVQFCLGLMVLTTVTLGTLGALVNNVPCQRTPSEKNAVSTVQWIDVDPCTTAPNGPCPVARGGNVKLTLSFTPTINVTNAARQTIAWRQATDVPLRGQNPRGCKYTNCRIPANTARNFTITIQMKQSFPPATYPVVVSLKQGPKVIFCQFIDIQVQ